MSAVGEEYLRFAREHLGGANEAAIDSLFYWNNPFALKHWTMNVVELLLLAGAVMAFIHARRVWKQTSNPTNLCLFWGTIIYLFVTEVPLYFSQLLGLDIGFVFAHNEFSAGILYNQTPLYIIALYPGLVYPSYVLVQESGLFERKYGLWLGALCVGVVHSGFYEIFDHFGPQYMWWAWNFDNPLVGLRFASVPWTSVIMFSLTPPMVATVLVRLLLKKYQQGGAADRPRMSLLVLSLFTVILGVLIPIVNSLLPSSMINSIVSDSRLAISLYAAVLIVAGVSALVVFARHSAGLGSGAATTLSRRYPVNFFSVYLLIFFLLWLYALPEYFSAEGGLTARGTPVGSLSYVVVCFVVCFFFIYRARAAPRS